MWLLGRLGNFFIRYRGQLVSEVFLRIRLRLWDVLLFRKFVNGLWKAVPAHPEKIVFLIGCYNSGTTITKDILGVHRDIRSLPREGARLASELPRPEDLGWTRMWVGCRGHMNMPENDGDKVADAILRDWMPWWRGDGPVFLEKSITNVTRMKWLDRHFKNAYFIGVVRNGYCAIEGIRRRARPKGQARAVVGDAYPLEMIAEQWVEANRQMLEGAEDVARYMQIDYETLVDDPVGTLTKIWEFLGIDIPDCSFADGTLRVNESRFPIASRNRESLSRLSASDMERINPIICEVQRHLGYEILEGKSIYD